MPVADFWREFQEAAEDDEEERRRQKTQQPHYPKTRTRRR